MTMVTNSMAMVVIPNAASNTKRIYVKASRAKYLPVNLYVETAFKIKEKSVMMEI